MVTGSSSSYVNQAANDLLKRLGEIEAEFQRAEVRDPYSSAGRSIRAKLRTQIATCDSKMIELVSSTLAYSEGDLNRCLDIKDKIYNLNGHISEIDHHIESRNATVPSLSIWQKILSLFITYPKKEDVLPVFRFNAFCTGLQARREKLVETELTSLNILIKTNSDVQTDAELRRKVESLSRSMQTGSVAAVAKIGEHTIDLQILSKPERELICRKITVRISDSGYESDSSVDGKQYFQTLKELLKSYGFTPKTAEESINSMRPFFEFEGAPRSSATAKEHISRLLDLPVQGKGHFCLVKSGDRAFDLLIQPEREGEQIREYSFTVTNQGNFASGDEIFQNFFELKNKFHLGSKTASQALVEYHNAKLKTLTFSKEAITEEGARELLADAPAGAYIIRENENAFQLVGKGQDGYISAFQIDLNHDPGNIRLLSAIGQESASGLKLEDCVKHLGLTSHVQASKRSEVIAGILEQLDSLKGKGIDARCKAAAPQMKLNQTYYLFSYDGDDLQNLKEFTLHTLVKEKTGPIASLAGRFGSEKIRTSEKTYRVNTQGQITCGDKIYDNFDAFLESIDSYDSFLELEDVYTDLKDQPYTTKEHADRYIEQTIAALGSSGARGAYALYEDNGKFFMHVVHPKAGMVLRGLEVTIARNHVSLMGIEESFKNFNALKEHFEAREQEDVRKQIEERDALHKEIKKLAQFNADGKSVLQNYLQLFGARTEGAYLIYLIQDGDVNEEVCIAYVKDGTVEQLVVDTTEASYVEEFTKSRNLTKSLLEVVEEIELQPTKDMKAMAKEYLDITSKEGEIKQKAQEIYKEKSVAMKNLLTISEILGRAACDGAYALVENSAKRGEYTGLVFKNNTIETYLLDLISNPGKIVIQPGNSTIATMNDLHALGFKKPVDAYQEDLKAVERKFANLTQSDAFETSVRSASDMQQFLHLAKLLGDQAKAVWCVRKKEEAKTQNGWTGWVSKLFARKEVEPTLELPKEGYCITLIKNEGDGEFLIEDYDISFNTVRGQLKVQNKAYNSLAEAVKDLSSLPLLTTKDLVKLHEKAKVQEQIIATQDMAKVTSRAEFGKSCAKIMEYAKRTPYAIFIYFTKRDVLNYTHNNALTSLVHSEQEIIFTWPDRRGELQVRHLNVCKVADKISVEEDETMHFTSLENVARHYCGKEAISLKSVWDGFQEWSKGHLNEDSTEENEATIAPPLPEEQQEKRARGRKPAEMPVNSVRSTSAPTITLLDIQQVILVGNNDEERLHDLLRLYPALKATIYGGDEASIGELSRMVLGRIHGQNFAVGVVGLRTLSSEMQSLMSQREDKDFIKELIKKARQ